jgi:hypothetical protein
MAEPMDTINDTTEAAMLVLEMGSQPAEERAPFFRRQVHRIFEPAFLPALVVVSRWMIEDEKTQQVALHVLATILSESRSLLESVPTEDMSPQAQATELIVAGLWANLDEANAYAAVGELCRRRHLRDVSELAPELDRISRYAAALAANHESLREGPTAVAEFAVQIKELVAALLAIGPALASRNPEEVDRALRGLNWSGPPEQFLVALQGALAVEEHDLVLLFERVSLAGLGIDRDALADYLGSSTETSGEKLAPLVRGGPLIVAPALEITADKLGTACKGWRSVFLRGWLEIAASAYFERLGDLVSEIIQQPPPLGATASHTLAVALTHRDPDVRRLAAVMCSLKGIHESVVVDELKRAVVGDGDDMILRLFAGLALASYSSAPPELNQLAENLARSLIPHLDDPGYDDTEAAGLLPPSMYVLLRAPIWIGRDRADRLSDHRS